MCKIIEFPANRTTNGYLNFVALFEICDNLESCISRIRGATF